MPYYVLIFRIIQYKIVQMKEQTEQASSKTHYSTKRRGTALEHMPVNTNTA